MFTRTSISAAVDCLPAAQLLQLQVMIWILMMEMTSNYGNDTKRWKLHQKMEMTSNDGNYIKRWKLHQMMETTSNDGNDIKRWKWHQKMEMTSNDRVDERILFSGNYCGRRETITIALPDVEKSTIKASNFINNIKTIIMNIFDRHYWI